MIKEPGLEPRCGAGFIEKLSHEVLESAAVNHPYLTAMRQGDFPNATAALQDFAFQYGLYSAEFTRYVSAVIHNLQNPKHKEILGENLAEEEGDAHDVELPPDVLATVVGQPHTLLFRRFQNAVGVYPELLTATAECPGQVWSRQFMELCEQNQYVGAGAIGIGTELIVSRIYSQILDGLKNFSDLTMTQHVFFDLHSECDDKHAAEMLSITEDLATDPAACEQIAHGVRTAIDLRVAFWDRMLERTRTVAALDFPAVDEVPAVGHRNSL